jgi:hypothetical protein
VQNACMNMALRIALIAAVLTLQACDMPNTPEDHARWAKMNRDRQLMEPPYLPDSPQVQQREAMLQPRSDGKPTRSTDYVGK